MADQQDAIGSVAEETMKLVFALSTGGGTEEHVCTNVWCPLCRLVNYVRDNPEAIERVTLSAAALARSVRDLIEQVTPSTGPAPDGTAPTTGTAPDETASARGVL